MNSETAKTLIETTGIIIVGGMTVYGTIVTKRVEKNQKVEKVLVNGRMDQLIATEGKLGEERGRALGRAEVLKELDNEKPFVIFLDDSPDDNEIIIYNIKLFGPIRYIFYIDEDQFINNLTKTKAVYVIDNKLVKRTGLNILEEVLEKNPRNIVILSTGSLENKSLIEEYHSRGIYSIVYKDGKNYLIELSDCVKDALKEL